MRVLSLSVSISLQLAFLLLAASVVRSSSSPANDPFIGISPQDEEYYMSISEIKCKDGSKKFTKAQLNDDFCDCTDGTDEPGTSACPNAKFFCRNTGHSPRIIFSSRVNDGICDCCDGSDEYDGKVKCPNTCWEAGKAAREELKKQIATYSEGLDLRKQEINQAKLGLEKDEAELNKLKSQEQILKDLVQQLKVRKEEIEKAEEEERLQNEKEEKERKDAELASQQENQDSEEKITDNEEVDESIHEDNMPEGSRNDENLLETGHVSDFPSDEEDVVSEKNEELSREELGRLVASRWTGESSDKPIETADSAKDDENEGRERLASPPEEHDGFVSDTDDDENDDHDVEDDAYDSSSSYKSDVDDDDDDDDDGGGDDLDFSEITSSNPSWLEKMQQTVKSILQAVNLFQTPVDKSEADRVRKEYDESSTKLSKMQSRILSLEKKLKKDFGPEKEFYSFYGHCFESKQGKYTYKVCPYKEASQEEGYSTTRLGEWDRYEESYQVMAFSNGAGCWNGPDRSMKVKLRCGTKNELMDADEPSRCEYVAHLSTPASCLEDKLKELQQRLDQMSQELPHNHDEL